MYKVMSLLSFPKPPALLEIHSVLEFLFYSFRPLAGIYLFCLLLVNPSILQDAF